MFCVQCGTVVKDGARFCSNCGWAVAPDMAAGTTAPEPQVPIPPAAVQAPYQGTPQYQHEEPVSAVNTPADFTTDKGITVLKKLTRAAQVVIVITCLVFMVLPLSFKIHIVGSDTVLPGLAALCMFGVTGAQGIYALVKGVQYKKILVSILSLAAVPGAFLMIFLHFKGFGFWTVFALFDGTIDVDILPYLVALGIVFLQYVSCVVTLKFFTKKYINPFSVGSVYSPDPEVQNIQSAPVVLEGLCTLVEIHEQGEAFSGQKVCKLQITPQCIRFVPNAYSQVMRVLAVINTILHMVTGTFDTGIDTFTAKDIREIPLAAITNIQKKKYNLFFPVLEINAGDQFVYRFTGKAKKVYEPLVQLWNAARKDGGRV